MKLPYANRTEAARVLADSLPQSLHDDDLLVLAMPRGGVPVGHEIAKRLSAPLDLLLVRKLGVPGHPELAFGAIATGGAKVLNDAVIARLGLNQEEMDAVAEAERAELRRRSEAYRGDRPEPEVNGKTIIVVDDGVATGATMGAGLAALRRQQPAKIVAAVPVGPPDSIRLLAEQADEVVCPATPTAFMAISEWYEDFSATSDDEVCRLLNEHWKEAAGVK
jgi:putative phosphoribosyl transferase